MQKNQKGGKSVHMMLWKLEKLKERDRLGLGICSVLRGWIFVFMVDWRKERKDKKGKRYALGRG